MSGGGVRLRAAVKENEAHAAKPLHSTPTLLEWVTTQRTPGSLESQAAEIFVERSLNHQLTSATTFGSGRAVEEGEVRREESCPDSDDS